MNREVTYYPYNPDHNKFETLSEFKWCIKNGAEIQFKWDGRQYGVMKDDPDCYAAYEANKGETERYFKTPEELLDYKLADGVTTIRDVILKAEITDRTLW